MTIFRRNSLLAIMILWSLFAAAPFGGVEARAEQACVVRNDAVEQLGKKFGEPQRLVHMPAPAVPSSAKQQETYNYE